MKIRYTREALARLDQIFSFVAADNPRAANAVKVRIERAVSP